MEQPINQSASLHLSRSPKIGALILGIGVGSYVFRDDNQATVLLDNFAMSSDPEQCNMK